MDWALAALQGGFGEGEAPAVSGHLHIIPNVCPHEQSVLRTAYDNKHRKPWLYLLWIT
jgi:hypothetical protein